MFHSASDMAAQTLYRSPTAALDGRYSRLEATKQCLSFPVQLTSNQQSRSLRKITYHRQSTTTKSSKSTSPPNQPTVIINQSAQSTRPNPTKCLPPTMSSTMPGTYDPTLYPNLMRYRNPQPATPTPPATAAPNGVPRHPIECFPTDEWRRCPLCRRTKLCVVLGRCVIYGQKVKVLDPRETGCRGR
jgi:hypothetical protein